MCLRAHDMWNILMKSRHRLYTAQSNVHYVSLVFLWLAFAAVLALSLLRLNVNASVMVLMNSNMVILSLYRMKHTFGKRFALMWPHFIVLMQYWNTFHLMWVWPRIWCVATYLFFFFFFLLILQTLVKSNVLILKLFESKTHANESSALNFTSH